MPKRLSRRLPTVCPPECPVCHLDLRREGYPYSHQHSGSGEQCPFQWEPAGALDPAWDPDQ